MRPYRPGAELIAQGGKSGTMYVLKSGHIEVVRDGVSIAVIDQPGAIFGEISVLLDVPNSATVRAMGPAEVYVIENAALALDEPAGMGDADREDSGAAGGVDDGGAGREPAGGAERGVCAAGRDGDEFG